MSLHFCIGFGMRFGSFLDMLLELLGIKRSPTCHQKSMRKLASKEVGSEEARLPETFPGWCQEGGEAEGKPRPLKVGGSEERKKRRKEERK